MNESAPSGPIKQSKQEVEPDLFELYLAFHKRRREGELLCENEMLSGSFLHKDDAVIIESEVEGQSFIFKVKETNWPNLDINDYHPTQLVSGRLDGASVPDKFTKQNLYLTGSGWGGSSRRINTIEPEARLYFGGAHGEFIMPPTKDYAIARKSDNGILKILKPRELSFPDENIKDRQEAHVEQIEILMKKFGFDRFDLLECEEEVGEVGSPEQYKSFENETFLADYVHGRADGNRFMIFNKKTRQMVAIKYFDFSDQNMLQVAYADMTDSKEPRPEDNRISGLSISGMYRSEVAIVTFTTSPDLGLDTVSYHPSDAEAMENLKLPKLGPNKDNNYVPVPDIQLWPNDDVRVLVGGSTFHDFEIKNPGTLEKLKKIITAKSFPDGRHMFQIGEKKIKIKNIDDILTEILGA